MDQNINLTQYLIEIVRDVERELSNCEDTICDMDNLDSYIEASKEFEHLSGLIDANFLFICALPVGGITKLFTDISKQWFSERKRLRNFLMDQYKKIKEGEQHGTDARII